MDIPNGGRRRRPTALAASAGALVGALAGISLVAALAGGAVGGASRRAAHTEARAALEAAHLPPLLTVPGEAVTLRYAIVCPGPDPSGGEPCDAEGDVYVRSGQSGAFRKLTLERGADSTEGRWFVAVPADLASSPDGFSYYAVLRDRSTGASLTLPAGGAAAPQRSLPLRDAVTVDLGKHSFGRVRKADARPVAAAWGDGVAELGLAGGRGIARVGPSAFDVGADGTITVLDTVNRRVVRWSRLGGGPTAVPLSIDGGLDDMALGSDGTIHVLQATSGPGSAPVLKRFGPDGAERDTTPIAERTWSQLRIGPDGPLVQQEPSEQWLPAAPGLTRAAQARAGRPGRALGDGTELVVLRFGASEVRVARVAGGSVGQAWRIVSATPLGEVQLAESQGSRLVLVTKTYTDGADDFVVLVLDARGVVQRFSVEPAQWAESAPLARFRLRGSSLYQLGSTPAGAFVDRFDLEVNR